jgi:hypothetical protein
MEVPHQPAGVAVIECGLIAAGLVLWRAHPVRSTVPSLEGDHRKNLAAATSCAE